MSSLRTTARVTLVFVTLLLSVLIMGSQTNDAQARRYTLTITNNSSRDIHRLQISSSGTGSWGSDLLGRAILRSGESRRWGEIIAGEYDLLLIDASESQCVLRRLAVFNDTSWGITDEWLSRNCQH
jgi:hypothetical protein